MGGIICSKPEQVRQLVFLLAVVHNCTVLSAMLKQLDIDREEF